MCRALILILLLPVIFFGQETTRSYLFCATAGIDIAGAGRGGYGFNRTYGVVNYKKPGTGLMLKGMVPIGENSFFAPSVNIFHREGKAKTSFSKSGGFALQTANFSFTGFDIGIAIFQKLRRRPDLRFGYGFYAGSLLILDGEIVETGTNYYYPSTYVNHLPLENNTITGTFGTRLEMLQTVPLAHNNYIIYSVYVHMESNRGFNSGLGYMLGLQLGYGFSRSK